MGSATGVNWSGYFVNVQTLKVSFLKRDEACRLILHPKEEYPGEDIFGDGVVEQIVYETNCHPFLVQAVCSGLIDALNTQRRERAEVGDVKEALEQVLEGWHDYFHDLWVRTDDEQRACLMVLQGAREMDLRYIGRESGLDERRVRRTVQSLVRRDLVVRGEGDMYRMATPMFGRWVEENG